jgi:hypothetical protein
MAHILAVRREDQHAVVQAGVVLNHRSHRPDQTVPSSSSGRKGSSA